MPAAPPPPTGDAAVDRLTIPRLRAFLAVAEERSFTRAAARLHVAQQNFDQARQALEEAVQLNPFDPSIHQYLADSYRRLGLEDKVRQEQDVLKRLQETP